MAVRWEKSCGYVPFRFTPEGLRYFLIRSPKGRWGFPKGHVEGSESEHETADREVFEEAGLRVRPLEGFRQEVSYAILSDAMKRVVFFAGEVLPGELRLQKEEVSGAGFFSLKEAQQLIWNADICEVLRQADVFIRERAGEDCP